MMMMAEHVMVCKHCVMFTSGLKVMSTILLKWVTIESLGMQFNLYVFQISIYCM